ncbi:MAG: carboxypeptidase M32, partial [Thermoleophilia bacterium]|nr:hypothetical protein [Gaiellaceae bacterium]MDW8339644.1 carboxypeptidase M32 [Thermoleophilia bacterium]
MEPALSELRERLAEIVDLRRAQALLEWDLEVAMPAGGAESRALQLGTLASVIHARSADERIGELLDELAPCAASLDPDSDDACLLRLARRDWEKARRLPAELVAELAETQARSYEAWVRAREEDDFPAFRPWLERILELRLRSVECFAPYED